MEILIGVLIGLFIGIFAVLGVLLMIESRCVGVLKIYNDPTDGQEYLFCELEKDISHIKTQKTVIFTVKDQTTQK